MKNIFLLLSFLLSISATAQSLGFDVGGVYLKALPIALVKNASEISDINSGYPKSWIKETDYISSELKLLSDEDSTIITGQNDKFTQEQMALLRQLDLGDEVEITVKYRKQNSATKENEVRTINFLMTVTPDVEAEYVGGLDPLRAYIQDYAITRIEDMHADYFDLIVIKFQINEHGQASNAKLVGTSYDKRVDQLLLDTISKMPQWKPARLKSGVAVAQNFELRVGVDIGGC